MKKATPSKILRAGLVLIFLAGVVLATPAAAQDKPNILVVWGDDIGQSNISAYTMGVMGYRTPNIDRIASEGMIFTDYYGEQSCTAGRSTFIMGQSVFRTGLSKVGLPGAELGIRIEDPTIAGLLKNHGYATGQFGKNHLGDRDEMLPTNHGFDEFYGNLYHLNAEEEPENEDYPGDLVLADGSTFQEKFGPRGVIHSYADGRIEDTGPLTKKRMETVDDYTSDRAIAFIEKAHAAGEPFFVWWSGTRMHFRTHVKEELRGISGQDEYSDGMVEHDMHIGKFLETLDRLGIADNTIVFYSTDNGPHYNTWPDAASTPFRGEKNTNWEGGWRVPAMVRWPGHIEAGSVTNEIVHHMDWLPTFVAAAGDPNIKDELKAVLEGDMEALVAAGEHGLIELVMATHSGMTTIEFEAIVKDWIATAKHPTTGRPFTEMVYQPMLELLDYLRANGFKTFIVSGGGIEFMRPWTEEVYGIPPEQVVGSSIKTAFEMRDDGPVLVRLPELDFIDDKEGKPVGINTHIGRRPIAAFGNSDGDLQMLQWTAAGDGPSFCLYVHHTDAEREWAYDRESHIGRLDKGLDEAEARGWTVVDMTRDWKIVFLPE